MDDLTPAQAKQWIAQEAAKHNTVESAEKRIASELQMMEFMKGAGLPDLPNSRQAHEGLVDLLRERFDVPAESSQRSRPRP